MDAAKAKKKAKKQIECIDLSSDTEEEEEIKDVFIMAEEDNLHFFGGDYASDNSEETDPFAAINELHEEMVRADYGPDQYNDEDDNDIMIIDV